MFRVRLYGGASLLRGKHVLTNGLGEKKSGGDFLCGEVAEKNVNEGFEAKRWNCFMKKVRP